jgi:hypothetical protein
MTARAVLVMIWLVAAADAAASPIALQWQDLIPQGGLPMADQDGLGGVVEHGAMTPVAGVDQSALVTDYHGRQVRIPGYVLPLEFDDAEVREFLLVPYVGACIHVPPPPANQIVYVTSEEGVPVGGMFEPVWVTGVITTASISNELADIGYQIEADLVEPYE